MAPTTKSALGMALNKNKSAFVDIPKPREMAHSVGRDNFTVVSTDATKDPVLLPTPPHSISPSLPPKRSGSNVTGHGPRSPSIPQESDMELQDGPNNPLTAEALDRLGDLESAGAITPGMLAKNHLPEILLNHGPLAIRHIMGHLNTTVPGFARITSAKARRLVVAALEGRGAGAEGGGADGDVVFEKVGWGRWDARRRGHGHAITPPGSLPNSSYHGAMQVPGPRPHPRSGEMATSYTATSGPYSDEDHDMLEHEADKMSLDGEEGGYVSSQAPDDPMMDDLDDGDVTDEEDWQSMGAEALRARSLPPGSLPGSRVVSGGGRLYQAISSYTDKPRFARGPVNTAQPVPVKNTPNQTPTGFQFPSHVNNSQERAAVEALLSLGSM